MDLKTIIALIGELSVIIAAIAPTVIQMHKIAVGQKCQLRSEMLHIYYRNKETHTIRQYEFENFIFLYEAYKALKGNSFIDKIYKEVNSWEVIT